MLIATASGQYEVLVSNICGSDTSASISVQVNQNPIADFYFLPEDPLVGDLITFIDQSISAASWNWTFGNNLGTSTDQNPQFLFSGPGTYQVTLMVWDDIGCPDTISLPITFQTFGELFIPNVFTPNGDGIIDEFVVYYADMTDILLVIFDRWGNKVFETRNPGTHWNGANLNGNAVQEGVYFYTLTARDGEDRPVKMSGNVTLMR
jgi:gliding motility-associated-like protein